MNNDSIVTCKKCNAKNKVIMTGEIFPGGKEREEYYCDNCNEELGAVRTSGFVRTALVEEKDCE